MVTRDVSLPYFSRPVGGAVLIGSVLGLVLMLLAPAVHAQTADDVLRISTRLPGTGTQSMGLGGAGTAGLADVGALYTNPAGLGFYESSAVVGGLNLFFSEDESVYQVGLDGPQFTETGEESAVRAGNLALIYKAPTQQGSLVIGLGLTQTSAYDRELSFEGRNSSSSITDTFLPRSNEYFVDDQGVGFPEDVGGSLLPFIAFQGGAIEFFQGDFNDGFYPFEQAVLPGTEIVQDGTVRRGGTQREVNFAGAVALAPGVMLGGGANITVGRYAFTHELIEIDQGGNADYEVLRNGRFYRGLDRITFRESYTSDLTGFNARLGLSAQVTPEVRLGVTAETPTWYSVDENFTDAFIRTDFLDGQSLAYGDEPGETEGQGTFDYEIITPWRLSTGLAYTGGPLTVTADVEFVDWTQLELQADAANFEAQNRAFEEYTYVFNWRGGIEYDLQETLTLRAGAAYRPDPRDVEFTLADGSTENRDRLFFSAGAGFHVSDTFTLNLAWMQERTHDQFVPYPSITPPNETAAIAVPFLDEEIVRNQFEVGVTYRF